MPGLTAKLAEVTKPKESPVFDYLRGLNSEDRASAWKALKDEKTFKTYRLLDIFNEDGGHFGKDSFKKFRTAVLAGEITEEDVHGAK